MKAEIVITSKDNLAVKKAAKLLTSAAFRREEGLFCLEGVRLTLDAVQNGYKIKSLFLTEKAEEGYHDAVQEIIKASDTVYKVSNDLFKKLSDTVSPQGVLAVLTIPETALTEIKKDGMYIALENTQDPANFGAISRTAEAMGVDGIIVSAEGCDPYSPKSLRAAMGSGLRLPVIKADDFLSLLSELKTGGMEIIATVPRGADEALGECEFKKGTVVLIGNEGNGLTEKAILLSSKKVTIKMAGRSESLNASAAAAMFIYEMMKGR